MILKTSYQELAKLSGRPYQSVVRAGKEYMGPVPARTGRAAREIDIDDALGVYYTGLMIDGGFSRYEAVTNALRLIIELEGRRLLPSQVWGERVAVPRIVARIHGDKIEFRIYDRWPLPVKSGQTDERWDEGPYTVRWFPETALGTTPTGLIFELELTGHLRFFVDHFQAKLLRRIGKDQEAEGENIRPTCEGYFPDRR